MAIPSSETSGIVKEDMKVYEVDLGKCYCSCNMFKHEGFPCRHAVCLALKLHRREITSLLPYYFLTEIYKLTYATSFSPIVIENLKAKPQFLPPGNSF